MKLPFMIAWLATVMILVYSLIGMTLKEQNNICWPWFTGCVK